MSSVNLLNSCILPFHDCEEIFQRERETAITPDKKFLDRKVDKLFKGTILEGLNLLFHLMPEKSKRRAYPRAELVSKLSVNDQSKMFEVFSCIFPDRYYSLQKGKSIAKLIECEKFFDAKNLAVEALSLLKVGESLFIPAGSIEHATVCVVKKVNQSEYELALFNTGFGCLLAEYGARSPVFSGLPQKKVCSNSLLEILMEPIEKFDNWIETNKSSHTLDELECFLLERVYSVLEGYFEKKPDRLIPHFQQNYGTCSSSSLEAAMCSYGSTETRSKLVEFVREKLHFFASLIAVLPQDSMKENKEINQLLLNSLPFRS